MVESEPKGPGSIAMRATGSTNYENLREFVEERVDPNQYFKTDGAQFHWGLRYMEHSLDLKVCAGPPSLEHLPIVHQAIGLLKRFLLGTYHGVSKPYLQRYLDEFCFRFNRRHRKGGLFESLMYACVSVVPMTYAELKL